MLVKKDKKIFGAARIALLLGAPLLLTACLTDYNPAPMPTGYKYHGHLTKAQPGGEPILKKIEHMRVPQSVSAQEGDQASPGGAGCPACDQMASAAAPAAMPAGAVSVDEAGAAASDLVTRLVSGFGKPVEPVWLASPASPTGAEADLDAALRSAMTAQGFQAASAPGAATYTAVYKLQPLDMGDGSRSMVTLALKHYGKTVTEVSGIYSLGTAPAHAPDMPAPHEHSGSAMSDGEPMPIGPLN